MRNILVLIITLINLSCQAKKMEQNDKKQQFLDAIKQIESSGGKNTHHKLVEEGPYAGQTAIGRYGMLPTTVQEVLSRARPEKEPNLEYLRQRPVEELKPMLEMNPELEDEVASRLADQVLNKNNQDLVRSAYGWNMGHNKNYKDLSKEELLQNVNARKMNEMLKPKREFKALTKGPLYGRNY